MLNKLRNIEEAGEAAMDQVMKAANSAAQSARDVSDQLSEWAKDGYGSARDAVKTQPLVWGAVSLGIGALAGGMYALWRRGMGSNRSPRKTMSARARSKHALRNIAKLDSGGRAAARKKTRRARQPANA